jgi:hypothetical protein
MSRLDFKCLSIGAALDGSGAVTEIRIWGLTATNLKISTHPA